MQDLVYGIEGKVVVITGASRTVRFEISLGKSLAKDNEIVYVRSE